MRRPVHPFLRVMEALVLLLAVGCATTHAGSDFTLEEVAALRPNQTQEEVIAIMGEPAPAGKGVGWAIERTGQEALDYPADRCTFLIYVSFEMGVGTNPLGLAASALGATTATTVKTTVSDMQILMIEFFDGRVFNIALNGEAPPSP